MKNSKYILLPEIFDIYGKFLFTDMWENGSWKAALDKHNNPYLKEINSKDKFSNTEKEAFSRAHIVVSRIKNLLKDGLVCAYLFRDKDYADNSLIAISPKAWQGVVSINVFSEGILPLSVKRKNRSTNEGDHNVYLRRDQCFQVLGIETQGVKPAIGNAGRPEKYDYGKITAILLAILLEEDVENLSQDKLAGRIIEIYQNIFPDEELPSVSSLEQKILKHFFNYKDNVQKEIRKK